MDFAANTIVVWNSQPSGSVLTEITAEASDMTAQGVTDGVHYNGILPNGWLQITRQWTTVGAADTWVSFITTYQPESAEVVIL